MNDEEKDFMLEQNFDSFKKDIKDGKHFVLFLGAGVNLGEGYPVNWDNLVGTTFCDALHYCAYENGFSSEEIKRIEEYINPLDGETLAKMKEPNEYLNFLKRRERFQSRFSPLVQAMIVKSTLGKGYIPLIQNTIYSHCHKGKIMESFNDEDTGPNKNNPRCFSTLYCLAKMILASDNIKAVITYNYDNFLTQAVEAVLADPEKHYKYAPKNVLDTVKKKRENHFMLQDISGMKHINSMKENIVPVYHVHGYIPDDTEIKPEDGEANIVLSMDETYETTRDVFSWQTVAQIHFLSNYACLFAGISFTGVATQRMLHYVNKCGHQENIYYLGAFHCNSDDEDIKKAEKAVEKMRNKFLQDYGLTPLYSWNGYEGLYNKLYKSYEEAIGRSNKKK